MWPYLGDDERRPIPVVRGEHREDAGARLVVRREHVDPVLVHVYILPTDVADDLFVGFETKV